MAILRPLQLAMAAHCPRLLPIERVMAYVCITGTSSCVATRPLCLNEVMAPVTTLRGFHFIGARTSWLDQNHSPGRWFMLPSSE